MPSFTPMPRIWIRGWKFAGNESCSRAPCCTIRLARSSVASLLRPCSRLSAASSHACVYRSATTNVIVHNPIGLHLFAQVRKQRQALPPQTPADVLPTQVNHKKTESETGKQIIARITMLTLPRGSFLSSCEHPLHWLPERDNRRNSVLQLCRAHRKPRQRPHAGSVSLACMTTVLFLP
jgi:hypothetical protein